VLHIHLDIGAVLQQRLRWPAQVALAVRRVLEELSAGRRYRRGGPMCPVASITSVLSGVSPTGTIRWITDVGMIT
jgi:hypothetical protein